MLDSNLRLQDHVVEQDARLTMLERKVWRECEAQAILQILMAIWPNALESVDVTALRERRAGVASLVRDQSVLERRGLPPGSVTLSKFCKRHSGELHQVYPRTLKGHLEAADLVSELITIYQRPNANIYSHEWWVTPAQQHELILFWKANDKHFEECLDCPHDPERTIRALEDAKL